ncbi:hypothetical protein QTP70_033195, partial [Hemibagrus guttatus]
MDNLEMPINLHCMSLDRWREPEYPEETPEAQGEHANSTHTAEVGIEPPTLEVFIPTEQKPHLSLLKAKISVHIRITYIAKYGGFT